MKKFIVALSLMLCGLFSVAPAQTSRGTVSGTVVDIAGAVVPGATITLKNTGTGLARTTQTNDEGFYRFDAVDLSTYSVEVNAPSFGALTKTNVVVNANQTSTVDAQLAPGGQSETVEVTATAGEALQQEAPVRGGNISSMQISQLPLSAATANNNPVGLALTIPGVTTNRSGVGIGSFSVNGARSRSNNFLLDGTENNDISVAGQGSQINNADAVQEVSVQTSNYDAEFGRAGGAVVNVITKSGTNDINGTLSFNYDTRSDDALTSSEGRVAENVLRGRPPSGTEYFASGTVGGPVMLPRFGEGGRSLYDGRNRTFFFGYYQERRQRSTSQAQFTVPTAAGRATLRQLFPVGANPNVDLLLDVTRNSIAPARTQDQALGNGRPVIEFGTFTRNFAQLFTQRQYLIRLDHKISDNDQLSGRFFSSRDTTPVAANFALEGFGAGTANNNYSFQTAYTRVFSPTVTNELRLAYNRIQFSFPLNDPSGLAGSLPNITYGIPAIGSTIQGLGAATNLPQGRTANNYVVQDTATKVMGNHTFRGGVDFLRQIATQSAPFLLRGQLVYSASTNFTAFANFVDDFGGTSGAAARDFGSPVFFPSLYRTAAFFQDRWKATESLTLTLGVRYEYFGVPFNRLRSPAFTGLFNVDPVTLQGPYDDPNQVRPDRNNFAPTVGIAYAPSYTEGFLGRVFGDRRSVIRAGYQIGYDSFFNNIASNAVASTPNNISTTVNSTASAGARGLANFSRQLPTVARAITPRDTQVLVTPNLVNPYYQRWSLGMQRELGYNLVLDVSYVGSKGTGLYINEDYNPLVRADMRITPAAFTGSRTCTPGTNIGGNPATPCLVTNRLDNLQGARTIRTNGGSSIYHSGQLEVRRRFADNFLVTGAYTYSRLIDNNSDVFANLGVAAAAPSVAALPTILGGDRLERGLSLFDRTHRATFTYVYEIPFFREQRGALGRLLGGFQIAGITTFESGVPYTVLNGLDSDGIGGNNDRPTFNPAGQRGVRAVPVVNAQGVITSYVNPDAGNAPIDPATARYIVNPAFNAALAGSVPRFGSLGRNTERSPGINNTNLNLMKRVRVTEGTSIELRGELFNVFNHPQFTTGSVSPFSPSGGSINSNANSAPAGTFLNPDTFLSDAGGRVVRYQVKLIF